MGNLLRYVCVVFVVAACQPMYKARPEKLKTPAVVTNKSKPPPPVPTVYLETCDRVDFRAPAKNVFRDPSAAGRQVKAGDTTIASAGQATADDAKRDLMIAGVEHYRSALQKDPYDAEATLKLALAYDHVLRKGCALAMLRRLNMLSTHPTFSVAAEVNKDLVRTNQTWFGDYRTDALKEIN